MKYQVIARRYRPRDFDEVVGQEATAATLRNALLQDRLAHAYLFCGPRGIGKTSMARIFARALNCPAASDPAAAPEARGRPCGACETCKSVHSGDDIDVIELDGASNRGIEDVREIIEGVKFAPSRSPYKIYIVDEVHMLTREAFNAFLKVLEEPPSHVKFVFATTEAHKIPDTVLSRCQRFDFRPVGEADIVRRLEQICEAEDVRPEAGLLECIARYSRGGLRDSQTMLDQMISFSDSELRIDDLDRITGRVTEDRLDGLVRMTLASDSGHVLDALAECWGEGIDPAVLLEQMIERLRRSMGEAVRGGSERADGTADVDRLVGALQILHETAARLKGSPYPQLAVELSVVKIARIEDVKTLDETVEWLRRFEELARSGASVPMASGARSTAAGSAIPSGGAPAAVSTPAPSAVASGPGAPEVPDGAGPVTSRAARAPARTAPASGPDFETLRGVWDQIMIELRESAPQVYAFVNEAHMEASATEIGTLVLGLPAEFHVRQMDRPEHLAPLENLIGEVSGSPWKVRVRLADPTGGSLGGPGEGEVDGETDAASPSGGARPSDGGGARLRDNPMVKKAVKLFRGRIV